MMAFKKSIFYKMLLVICVSTYGYIQAADDIPNLDDLTQEYGLILPELRPWFVIRNYLVLSTFSEQRIQAILHTWYNDNPDLKNYYIPQEGPDIDNPTQVYSIYQVIGDLKPRVTYVDICSIVAQCAEYMQYPFVSRANIVVTTLKDLGVKQTLSAQQIEGHVRIIVDNGVNELSLAKQLLGHYCNENALKFHDKSKV